MLRIVHEFIIIIIINKSQQCKSEREWYTPYQSEYTSPHNNFESNFISK